MPVICTSWSRLLTSFTFAFSSFPPAGLGVFEVEGGVALGELAGEGGVALGGLEGGIEGGRGAGILWVRLKVWGD